MYLKLCPICRVHTTQKMQPSREFGVDTLEVHKLNLSPYLRIVSSRNLNKMLKAHLRAMLPLRANEMAFINSVVFGTRANKVTPRNFSSMPEPSRTTSTTSTRISELFF